MSASPHLNLARGWDPMDTGDVEVLKVEASREEIDYGNADVAEALRALVPGGRAKKGGLRLPLAKEKLTIELRGVPTAVPSALRRVLAGELRGRCLTFDHEGFVREETTDPFMADQDFVRTRIRMIPLRPQISEAVVKDLRLALTAVNDTAGVMTIYSGDLVVVAGSLTEPIFNPTHEIAFLQPGRTLRIDEIRIAEGFGSQDAAFAVTSRAALKPLDLEEHPREATHGPNGAAAGQSGFRESSSVANPRHHEVSAYIPAAPENPAVSISVVVDACAAIMERLRFIQGVLDSALSRPAAPGGGLSHRVANAHFLVTGEQELKGVLTVKNETDTVGNLLARVLYELTDDIQYVGYTCVPHEKEMTLTVVHPVGEPSEIAKIMLSAVKHSYGIFSQIQQGIRARG